MAENDNRDNIEKTVRDMIHKRIEKLRNSSKNDGDTPKVDKPEVKTEQPVIKNPVKSSINEPKPASTAGSAVNAAEVKQAAPAPEKKKADTTTDSGNDVLKASAEATVAKTDEEIKKAGKEEERRLKEAEKEELRKIKEAEKEELRKVKEAERAEREQHKKERDALKEEQRKIRNAEKEEQRKIKDAEKEEQRKIKAAEKEERDKEKEARRVQKEKLKEEKQAEKKTDGSKVVDDMKGAVAAGAAASAAAAADGQTPEGAPADEAEKGYHKDGVWKNIVERMNSVSEGDDELGRDIEDEVSDEIFFSPEEKKRKRRLGLIKLYVTLAAIAAIAIIIAFFTVRNNSFRHIYEQGVKAFNEEDYDSAIATFEKLSFSEEGEKNVDVLNYLAQSYIKNERYQDAVDVYNRALASDPTFGPAVTGLCEMYKQMKDGRSLNAVLDKYRGSNMEEFIADYMVSNPVTNPDAGKYEDDLEIKLTGDESVPIFYTLDGSDPNEQSSIYSKPIKASEGTTQIKAIAINTLGIRSGIIDKSFTVEYPIPGEPKIALNSGIYVTGQTVTISGDEGCDIYYTTDGSTPTRYSDKYTGPLRLVKGNVILTAIAISNHGKESTITSKNYIIVQNARELEEVEKINNPTTESSQSNGETGESGQNPNETDSQYTEGSEDTTEETSENEGLFDWLLNDRRN